MKMIYMTIFLINAVVGYNNECRFHTESNDISILFSVYKRDIRVGALDKPSLSLQYNDTSRLYAITSSSYGLDYNIKGNYFIRSNTTSIYLSPYHDGWRKSQEILLYNFESYCLSGVVQVCDQSRIAIDWIHNLLYYSNDSSIYVAFIDKCNTKVAHKIVNKNCDYIKSIAVNPLKYFIVWIAWFGAETKIIKASQDGSNQQILVETDMKKSYTLALDFEDKRIYWVDIELFRLSSIDYNGNDRKVILESETLFKSCYSMDIMNNNVFWTNELANSIMTINKYGRGSHQVVVSTDNDIESFKIIEFNRQPYKENICESANCQYLCLPINDSTFRCVCPHFKLEDGKECINYHHLIGPTNASTLTINLTMNNELSETPIKGIIHDMNSSPSCGLKHNFNDGLDYTLVTLLVCFICLMVTITQLICLFNINRKLSDRNKCYDNYDDTFIQYKYSNKQNYGRTRYSSSDKTQFDSNQFKSTPEEGKNIYETLL